MFMPCVVSVTSGIKRGLLPVRQIVRSHARHIQEQLQAHWANQQTRRRRRRETNRRWGNNKKKGSGDCGKLLAAGKRSARCGDETARSEEESGSGGGDNRCSSFGDMSALTMSHNFSLNKSNWLGDEDGIQEEEEEMATTDG